MTRLLYVLFLFFSLNAFASPKLTQWCFNESLTLSPTEIVDWKYCLFITENSPNHDVIYHLHGLGGDNIETKGWSNTTNFSETVRSLWEKNNFQAPTVVSISFGPAWLLAEKNQSPVSGLYEILNAIVLPKIEETIVNNVGLIGKRHILGISMGGFNASQMVLKNPGLFTKAALLCPAIVNLSPFATEEEIQDYISRTNALPDRVETMSILSRYFFPNLNDWDIHSPILLATTKLTAQSPELYVSCGTKDEFGFQEGAKLFADIAINVGIKTTWVPIIDAGHCAIDPITVAEFFMN